APGRAVLSFQPCRLRPGERCGRHPSTTLEIVRTRGVPMPTLARPRVETRTPEVLVNDVRSGLIRLPPFQRGYKWEADDVVTLFDSLLRGYPAGNLLLSRPPPP